MGSDKTAKFMRFFGLQIIADDVEMAQIELEKKKILSNLNSNGRSTLGHDSAEEWI